MPPAPAPAKRGRKPRAKPGAPTEAEQVAAGVVLERLAARTGVRYRSPAHTALVVARLRDGYSERDLRAVVAYCAERMGWQTDPKMAAYLRPATLFGPQTVTRYADEARTWADEVYPEPLPGPETGPKRPADSAVCHLATPDPKTARLGPLVASGEHLDELPGWAGGAS